MKKPSALILCAADPNSSPRPNRMIHWLKDDYDVTVVGWTHAQTTGVKSIPLFGLNDDVKKKATGKYHGLERCLYILQYLYRLITRRYEDIVWSRLGRARELQDELICKEFDLIVSHDITLLPLAFNVKREYSKIILDAREYYMREFEDRWQWRLLSRPVNQYLCEGYLHRCNKIITVNDGLAQEYADEFKVFPEVVMSLPQFADLRPVPADDNRIRLIYHGLASTSRGTETMIEMMDFLDDRFLLDMMLVVSHGKYWEKIVAMAESRRNVNIVPPVPMEEIVPFTNRYDIGLYLCPPTSFNQKHTLPNKFFEFIQARLAVAIGPSIEMEKIVKKYDCGVVAKDFKPRSLAEKINRLTTDEIMYYKRQSHQAAGELSSETNKRKIHDLFAGLLAGN
jgi:hypothetical protein